MFAGKNGTASLLFLAVICVSLLVWTGCSNPGGGGSSEPVTTTIKGTTLYSADGGATTQPANFQFDVPTTATKGVGARGAASDWIAVTGQIRAGDILINLSGTFNTTTKEFNLRASGYVLTLRIDMTIKGLYTPSTGTISQGQTDVAVTDTSTGATQTYSTSTVKEGQDATKPIADAPTTATPPTAAQTKFWEGIWAGSDVYYYNSDGTPSSTPTSISMSQTCTVTVTGSQFQERIIVSSNLPTSWGYEPWSFYQTGVIEEILSETSTEAVAIFTINQAGDDSQLLTGYMKGYITLLSADTLTGGPYYDSSGNWLFATVSDAKTLGVTRGNGTANLTLKKIN